MSEAAAEIKVEPKVEEVDVKPTTEPESTDPPTATEVAPKTEEADEDVTMDESEEEKKNRACRQIEFYFSDSNLPYDRFMWTLHSGNAEHWVPIETVASFKRMREFKPHGLPWVVEALQASKQLEVDAEGTRVRRVAEVQQPKGAFERSIYAKGFGKEDPTLQKKMENFFNKYGWTNAVRMRRTHDSNEFKGSVFVEFSDLSSVDAFLKAEPKPSWNGEDLLIMTKEAYCEMKIKEKGLNSKAANNRRENAKTDHTGRKSFNAFKEMEREKKRERKEKGQPEPKPEVYLEFMGSKIRIHDEDGGSVKVDEVPYVKGSALKFLGCGGEVNFLDIKEPLKVHFGRAPFIKYTKGDDTGLVGFDKALSEEDIAFVKEKIKTLSGKEITWTAAEEGAEKEFLVERAQSAAKKALNSTNAHGGRGGARGRGGRGGRGRGRGRGGRDGGGRRDGAANGKENDKEKPTATTEATAAPAAAGEEQTGDKRKRTVEPDGGSTMGTRNAAIPTIQSAKKAKTEEGS